MTSDNEYWVLQDEPDPFFLEAGPIGILLLHGFTGTSREMHPLGEYLHRQGLSVSAPLMPGHGSTLTQMNRYGWRDWLAAAESAYVELSRQCEQVFVGGFSMGSLLALGLAEQHPALKGSILFSPSTLIADWRIRLTPLARYFVSSTVRKEISDLHNPEAEVWLGGFQRYPIPAAAELRHFQRYVLKRLRHIQSPVLVIYSLGDRSIHPRSGEQTVQRLSKYVPVEKMVLQQSGHAVVVDAEWEKVAERTYSFIEAQSH